MLESVFMAVWLGVLTSISPCPLASNIAAISFLGKKISRPFMVLVNGVFYTLGRACFYILIGWELSYFMAAIPMVSDFLQTKANYWGGPIMIILGVIMLDVIPLHLPSLRSKAPAERRVTQMGGVGAFFLGFLFASMLCPVSVAFFFSNLLQSEGNIWMLLLYGVGTGIPVFLCAFVLAFCAGKIGAIYKATTVFEQYARRITAVIFLGVGFYLMFRSWL